MTVKNAIAIFVRFAALTLFLLSAVRAWAGVYEYLGMVSLRAGHNAEALSRLKQAMKIGGPHPRVLELALQAGGEPESAEAPYACEFARVMPLSSPALLKCAASRIKNEPVFTSGEVREIRKMILSAAQFDPSGPNTAYESARLLMSPSLSSAGDKEWIVRQLKKAMTLRWKGQAAPYLKPAAELILDHSAFFPVPELSLRQLTPYDYVSYSALMQVLQKNRSWLAYAYFYGDYLKLRKEAYALQCAEGLRFLRDGNSKKAQRAFLSASWIAPDYLFAKAGLIAAGDAVTDADLLEKIAEEEDEDLSPLYGYLAESKAASGDPYPAGLIQIKLGHYEKGAALLSQSGEEKKYRRRYLALAEWKTGNADAAAAHLKSALIQEQPDLRELYLLKEIEPSLASEVDAKTVSMQTSLRPADAWPGDGILSGGQSAGMLVNLKPGSARIMIHAIVLRGAGHVLLSISLQGHAVFSDAVSEARESKVEFPVSSSGGKRWLELRARSLAPGGLPVIKLANVEIVQ